MGDGSGEQISEELRNQAKDLLKCASCTFTARKPSTMHYHRQFMGHYAIRYSPNGPPEQSGSSNGSSTSAPFSNGTESIDETEGWFEMESIEFDDGCTGSEEPRTAEEAIIEVKENSAAHSSKTNAVANDSQRHRCPICRVPSWSRTYLERHMLVHTKQRPIACAVCGRGIRDMSSLKRHMLVHSDERPFGCTICMSRFKLRCDLTKHMRKVHQQTTENAPRRKDAVAKDTQRHQCPICRAAPTSKLNLERHMLGHTRQRSLTCVVCRKGIRDMSSLKRHMMLVHSDERPFECTLCTSNFKLQCELNKHMKAVHGVNAPIRGNVPRFAVNQYQFKICLRTCPTKENLKSHMLVHVNRKRVLCTTCGGSFRDKAALKRHTNVHSSERPCACSECDFTTKHIYSLTLHQRRHTGELFS